MLQLNPIELSVDRERPGYLRSKDAVVWLWYLLLNFSGDLSSKNFSLSNICIYVYKKIWLLLTLYKVFCIILCILYNFAFNCKCIVWISQPLVFVCFENIFHATLPNLCMLTLAIGSLWKKKVWVKGNPESTEKLSKQVTSISRIRIRSKNT